MPTRPLRAGLLAALLALGLAGCETSFYNAKTAGPQLESALALPAGSLKAHGACMYGVAGRVKRSTEFFPAACAVDAGHLYVVEWDDKAKAYRRGIDLAFGAVPAASYANYALGDELHVPVDGGVLAVAGKGAKQWHDAMVAAGVKDAPTDGPVSMRAPPSPTPIYIYIPQ